MHKSHWGSLSVKITGDITFADRLFVAVCLVATLAFTFPHMAAGNTSGPLIFEVENLGALEAAKAAVVETETEVVLELVPNPRIETLRAYLATKNSPMAPFAEALLSNKHYEFIVGISFAESNFCKKNIRPYNCWGIGGGYPEQYRNYPHAFERANLLITKYHERGLTTPETMRTRWVGWHNDNWIIAVNQAMGELKALGL